MFIKLLAAGVLWVLNYLQSPAGHGLVDQACQELENALEAATGVDDGDDNQPGNPAAVPTFTQTPSTAPTAPVSNWHEVGG